VDPEKKNVFCGVEKKSSNYSLMTPMLKKETAGIVALVTMVGMFFVSSAILFSLWNSVVMDSLSPGAVVRITYIQACGLTLFASLFIQGPRVFYDCSRIIHDEKTWK